MSHRRLAPLAMVLAVVVIGCAAVLSAGRDFPSPARGTIENGVTSKADLVRLFGEPTEVGIDDGDPTWTWYFVKAGDPHLSKRLTVRFAPDGVVSSYSFSSNFPEDMKALR